MDDTAASLPLAASLGLLLTRDDGRFAVDTTGLDLSLAGAVLADLAIAGYIELSDTRVLLTATSTTPSDPILAGALGIIRAEAKPRSASWWVSRLQGKDLRTAVLSALVASGSLERVDRKVLGLFPASAYPEVDGATEQALRVQLGAVLTETVAPTPHTAALVALLGATTALRRQFGPVPKDTVRRITEGEWAAPAVTAVINEIAMVVIVTASIVASTTATTS
jgi:hypothetical protein